MPDEAMAPETESQDTPIEAASTEEKPADVPAVDWEQRYNSLRPEYDRSNQLLAAARGDHGPDAQMQALQQLGVELQQEAEEEDEFEDPYDTLARRQEALEQKLQAREEAEQRSEMEKLERQLVDDGLKELEKGHKLQLSKEEKAWVVNNALANRHEFQGIDDLKAALTSAFDAHMGFQKTAYERYLASKKETDTAPVGAVGEESIDLSNPKQKLDWMAKEYARISSED